jgi:hypothetical protein
MKKRAVLDAECAKMKAKLERSRRASPQDDARLDKVVTRPPFLAIAEKCHSLKAVAAVIGCSTSTIRRIFAKEPGIVYIGQNSGSQRRAFVIPESVFRRVVHTRSGQCVK